MFVLNSVMIIVKGKMMKIKKSIIVASNDAALHIGRLEKWFWQLYSIWPIFILTLTYVKIVWYKSFVYSDALENFHMPMQCPKLGIAILFIQFVFQSSFIFSYLFSHLFLITVKDLQSKIIAREVQTDVSYKSWKFL